MSIETFDLFGGKLPWSTLDWTSSDDRVRGGKSQSYLLTDASSPIARFTGTLDITALGGAGFASQRTTRDDKPWDLSDWDGIGLKIVDEDADDMKYTLTLKPTIPPTDAASPTQREQSTVSYEVDFKATKPATSLSERSPSKHTLHVPFSSLKPTYRGRPCPSAPALDTSNIARFGLMCRSHFGDQSGEFDLRLVRIFAFRERGVAGRGKKGLEGWKMTGPVGVAAGMGLFVLGVWVVGGRWMNGNARL